MKEFIVFDSLEKGYRMSFMERYIPIFILVAFILFIYLFKERIRGNLKTDRLIRSILLIIDLIITSGYYLGRWIYSGVDFRNLPLHLCYLCNIFCIIILLTKDRRLYNFLVFAGVLGGIASLISIDLTLTYRSLKYYYFMISHISIIIVPLYFSLVYKYSVTYKEIIKSFFYLQLLGIIMGIINYLFASNYFFVSFTSNIAAKGTILESLGNGYYYFIKLEILSIIYLVFCLIINIIIKSFRKNGQISFDVYNIR